MQLAGITISRLAVLVLAQRLTLAGHDDVGTLLLITDASGDAIVGLSIADRDAIISVLDDPPKSLAPLRTVLVDEHRWRVREGLV